MDCSSPGSSAHGLLQAEILEWVSMPSSRSSSHTGIEPESPVAPALQADSTAEPPGRPCRYQYPPFQFDCHVFRLALLFGGLAPWCGGSTFQTMQRACFLTHWTTRSDRQVRFPLFPKIQETELPAAPPALVSTLIKERSVKEGKPFLFEELCCCHQFWFVIDTCLSNITFFISRMIRKINSLSCLWAKFYFDI